jgi:hypothetical protein
LTYSLQEAQILPGFLEINLIPVHGIARSYYTAFMLYRKLVQSLR